MVNSRDKKISKIDAEFERLAQERDELIANTDFERLQQNRDELLAYEYRLIQIRDQWAILETAREDGYKKGYEIGYKIGLHREIERGYEQGMRNSNLKIAENLLDILDDETIADKIGLPLETVQELRKLAELK